MSHASVEAREAILEHFGALMRHVSGWHAPEFLAIDVTMSQAKCLYVVALRPGIGMSALAAQLRVGLSAVSGLVDRLVEHGYLARQEDPADRRQQRLSLTDDGAAVIDRIRELNTDHLRLLLAGLGAAELQALRTGMAALDREARRIDQAGPTRIGLTGPARIGPAGPATDDTDPAQPDERTSA